MTYRYPFTPYPRGWYRIKINANTIGAFGRIFTVHGKYAHDKQHPDNTYPIAHHNGYDFLFYDNNNQSPCYKIPQVKEFDHTEWQKPFRLSWNIKMHVQEVVENAIDLAHFCKVHTYDHIPILNQFKLDAHCFNVNMCSARKIFGLIHATSDMDITYHGMGIVVANVINKTSYANIILKVMLTTTPLNQEWVRIEMDVAVKKLNLVADKILRAVLPREIATEFSRDIPVWEAKIYHQRPLLCRSEANIIRLRKWAEQFYD